MNRLDVPVYMGEPRPLKRDYVNALDTHGADGSAKAFCRGPRISAGNRCCRFSLKALIKEKSLRDRPGSHDKSCTPDPESPGSF